MMNNKSTITKFVGRKIVLLCIVFTLFNILYASNVFATCSPNTYYIDYATGNDSNAGNCTTTPWKHQPYMNGSTVTYTHRAGDKFIFKGGVIERRQTGFS